jgi:hypothetical protein
MTTDKVTAYHNALAIITPLKGVKLSFPEFQTLEDAAEGRLLETDQALQADLLNQANDLLQKLVESDRWIESTAKQLRDELEACGDV